jgi:hypothetical protein
VLVPAGDKDETSMWVEGRLVAAQARNSSRKGPATT